MERRRERKKRDSKVLIVAFIAWSVIMYSSGFGHGQSSAYLKMNDDRNIMNTFVEGLKDGK